MTPARSPSSRIRLRRSPVARPAPATLFPVDEPPAERRFLSAPKPEPVPTPVIEIIPFVAHPDEIGSPDSWLYVSKRLDLEWFPNTPLWSSSVISIHSAGTPTVPATVTVYYRLSARTLNWLEKAGYSLERQWLSGSLPRTELDTYLTAMHAVWTFSANHLTEQSRAAARLTSPSLPDAVESK